MNGSACNHCPYEIIAHCPLLHNDVPPVLHLGGLVRSDVEVLGKYRWRRGLEIVGLSYAGWLGLRLDRHRGHGFAFYRWDDRRPLLSNSDRGGRPSPVRRSFSLPDFSGCPLQ